MIVEAADRVGRRHDLQGEVGEGLHVGVGELALVAPEQGVEGDVERLECERRVVRQRIAVEAWPPVRSPRQCIGPWFAMPRSVCVVIGPFIGWNGWLEPVGPRKFGFGFTTSSGLPRSQARLSKSPKMWQLEHDASPLLDVKRAS